MTDKGIVKSDGRLKSGTEHKDIMNELLTPAGLKGKIGSTTAFDYSKICRL
jgi:hypothetical protein